MNFDFNKKYGGWALVTGATSGIGEQIAEQLAADGMNLVLVARREEELKRNSQRISDKHNVKTEYIVADLSRSDGVNAVKKVNQNIGLLVLSAGLENNGAFEKINLESERQLVNVNVLSTMELAHHFSNLMVNKGKGGILFVASLFGQMGSPYFSNYAGSKAYVINFGQSLYGELKPKGVDVSILSPGLTKTPMADKTGVNWNKVPFAAKEPQDVARIALKNMGKKVVIVPGLRNQISAFSANLTPRKLLNTMVEKIMSSALPESKL
ncbi:short-chain dehydrogenase [Photobacterium rosenbergii]|uniref:Short-chain dehydrogenase n=1 Tax=Photobacterium rosenbergii TaxID=294936 RepID=A0A2T3NJX8_9GAMM|nr:SDR family NAD(P)-dependent oxidoreductase [Photobacterium rosenbergii]PSW15780.1 short-chain dehydrogenase [Photobacterium rosenbergii]